MTVGMIPQETDQDRHCSLRSVRSLPRKCILIILGLYRSGTFVLTCIRIKILLAFGDKGEP